MKLPLFTTKPDGTKPYKDWLRSCGIHNVVDEDYTMRIWENWLLKSNRVGKKTPNNVLKKMFPNQNYLKQLDIGENENRSSDINLQVLGCYNRNLVKAVSNITISEHAVKRWWEHTGTKPDILSWLESWENVKTIVKDDGKPITEVYHKDALLLGELTLSESHLIGLDIDSKNYYYKSDYAFRVKTVIPCDKLNEGQTTIWYKLKEAAE